jgi:hypothetical protein
MCISALGLQRQELSDKDYIESFRYHLHIHKSVTSQRAVSESEVSAADFLIGRVAQKTCQMFADAVLRIPMLEQHAHSQLITDIGVCYQVILFVPTLCNLTVPIILLKKSMCVEDLRNLNFFNDLLD